MEGRGVKRGSQGSGGGEISPPGSWGSGGKRESRKTQKHFLLSANCWDHLTSGKIFHRKGSSVSQGLEYQRQKRAWDRVESRWESKSWGGFKVTLMEADLESGWHNLAGFSSDLADIFPKLEVQPHIWEFKQALGCILVLVLALVKHQTSCKCRDVRGEVAPKSRRRVAFELFRKQETFLFLKIQSPFWKRKMHQLALFSSKYVIWYPLLRLLTSATTINKSCYLKLLAIVNKCQGESKYIVLNFWPSRIVFFKT